MPILVAPAPVVQPPVPVVYATEVSWTAANGRATQLTAWRDYANAKSPSGIVVEPGVLGLTMPTFDFFTDRSPVIEGEEIRGVRANPRQITIPLLVWGPDRPTYLNLFHSLLGDLNPILGEGLLSITESDGSTKTIGAYYASGLEGDDNDDTTGRHWMKAAVVFRTSSPYWEGDQVSQTFGIGGSGNFLPFAFPVSVRDSQVLGAVTVTPRGNVETYPVFTVTGPCTSITLANNTLGKTLVINKAMVAGDTAVLDFREGEKTAVLNGPSGTNLNLYPFIPVTSSMWFLNPGDNAVAITIPGAAGTTTVQMSYRAKYLAAY